jgi:hypothetical protein
LRENFKPRGEPKQAQPRFKCFKVALALRFPSDQRSTLKVARIDIQRGWRFNFSTAFLAMRASPAVALVMSYEDSLNN